MKISPFHVTTFDKTDEDEDKKKKVQFGTLEDNKEWAELKL